MTEINVHRLRYWLSLRRSAVLSVRSWRRGSTHSRRPPESHTDSKVRFIQRLDEDNGFRGLQHPLRPTRRGVSEHFWGYTVPTLSAGLIVVARTTFGAFAGISMDRYGPRKSHGVVLRGSSLLGWRHGPCLVPDTRTSWVSVHLGWLGHVANTWQLPTREELQRDAATWAMLLKGGTQSPKSGVEKNRIKW